MDQQPIEDAHASNESDDKTDKKAVKWRHVFDWGFWTGHPLAVFAMFLGGILLASITNFPGGNPKTLWYFAWGLWIFIGAIIWWVFGGIIARMEGRELLTAQEIESREQSYREGIQTRLQALETGISDTQRQIEEQRPRHLTEEQRLAIKNAIAPFPGQKITVKCLTWDAEASHYGQDFVSLFQEAGWDCGPIDNTVFPMAFYNVQMFMTKVEKMESAPPATLPLHQVLIRLGISKDDGMVHFSDDTKSGELTMRIGARPPTWIKPLPTADASRPSK